MSRLSDVLKDTQEDMAVATSPEAAPPVEPTAPEMSLEDCVKMVVSYYFDHEDEELDMDAFDDMMADLASKAGIDLEAQGGEEGDDEDADSYQDQGGEA